MEDDSNFCPTLDQNGKEEKNPRMEDDSDQKLAEKFSLTIAVVMFLGFLEFFLGIWFLSRNPPPCDQIHQAEMSGVDSFIGILIFFSPLFALYAIYRIFKKK